jgi:hypothetical protein
MRGIWGVARKRYADETLGLFQWVALLLVMGLLVVSCGGGGGGGGDDPGDDPGDVKGAPGTIGTVAGTGQTATDSPDADSNDVLDAPIASLKANFSTPVDMAFNPVDGRLYIMDWNGHKIRALSADGTTVSFIAGTGFEGDGCRRITDGASTSLLNPDGTCPTIFAEFNHMTDAKFDAQGRMVVSAWHNARIKRLDFSLNVVENVCGDGTRRFKGDAGACTTADGTDADTFPDHLAAFDLPSSIVFDRNGNLLISDQANQVIRRIGTDGVIKTVAGDCDPLSEDDPATAVVEGVGFGCEDGQGYVDNVPATQGKLNTELGQTTDPQGKIDLGADGSLYIADTANNVVRKVLPGNDGIIGDGDSMEEIISTIAGTGVAGALGDGGAATSAQLNAPRDVEVAPDGTIYVADTENHCIRAISTTGIITTYAGRCGTSGSTGEGGPATLGLLKSPYGIELNSKGDLYIADSLNHVIRVVYK